MKLHSIEYNEYDDRPYKWSLEELVLVNINLIVGRNAVGKSRILRIINSLARLIDGSISPLNMATGYYKATFREVTLPSSEKKVPKPDITYEIEVHNNKVKKELLKVGDLVKLSRNEGGRGSIYFDAEKSDINVQIPEANLAISSRRDSKQHPFFEELHEWANSVRYFEFSKTEQEVATIFEKSTKTELFSTQPINRHFHLLFKYGSDKFGQELIRSVIGDMRKIGYELTELGLMPIAGVVSPILNSDMPQAIYVKEAGIEKKLGQHEISNGMFRALVTLILIHITRLEKKPGCLLIDDIGEGLDFDRATKLISVLVNQAEKGFSQFCLTSNDRFVMNNVSLEYWCVVERQQGLVKSYSQRNAPDAYDSFREFGFNNFDFFANEFFKK
jgi:energy-coupling factor transporter ATP-binding protein EcfA2